MLRLCWEQITNPTGPGPGNLWACGPVAWIPKNSRAGVTGSGRGLRSSETRRKEPQPWPRQDRWIAKIASLRFDFCVPIRPSYPASVPTLTPSLPTIGLGRQGPGIDPSDCPPRSTVHHVAWHEESFSSSSPSAHLHRFRHLSL